MSFSSDSTAAELQSPRHRLYKTKMCKHFIRGNCLYGVHCGFSHAEDRFGLFNYPPATFSLAHHLAVEDEWDRSRRTLVDDVMLFGLAELHYLAPSDLKRLTDLW